MGNGEYGNQSKGETKMIRNVTGVIGALLLGAIVVGGALAGTIDSTQAKWYNNYKKQANAPKAEAMLLNTDPEPDLKKGFKPLFNGKDLKGWTPQGGTSKFEAKDGVLIGTCVPGSPSTYLCTDKTDYTDFIFTCDMKWEVETNSGVMFRALLKEEKKKDKTVTTIYGPQAEMEEFSKGRGWSGGIYGQSCGGYYYPLWLEEHKKVRAAQKEKEWNRLTIMAKGKVVKTWINGVPAAHWVDDTYLKGYFGLQMHAGKKGKVLWRNIQLKDLSK